MIRLGVIFFPSAGCFKTPGQVFQNIWSDIYILKHLAGYFTVALKFDHVIILRHILIFILLKNGCAFLVRFVVRVIWGFFMVELALIGLLRRPFCLTDMKLGKIV